MKKSQDPKLRQPGQSRANKGKAIRDPLKGRICTGCDLYKNRDQFFEHPSGFNGLSSRCKDCIKEYGKSEHAIAVKKALYNNRKANGDCIKCGSSELISNGIMCLSCWFQDKAVQRAGGTKNAIAIKAIWEQQEGRCFYTGEILIPGVNASLDHQVPTSRGGLDDPSNLRWTTNQINMIKNNMTHNEFIELCRNILVRFNE